MKINQFAHLHIPYKQQLFELKNINFINDNNEINISKENLFIKFLKRSFIDAYTESIFNQKLNLILATPTMNVYDYFHNNYKLNTKVFYCIGMQLLDFEVKNDFNLDNPFPQMDKYNIFYQKENIKSSKELISAWYNLLCTHTKYGGTYLDKLATNGYFKQFWNISVEKKPLIFNGKCQPIFDTDKLIREIVYVESPLDTDKDGKRDLLKVKIIRPSDTNKGLKVPVIYTASPYNEGTNDISVKKMIHDVNTPLYHKKINHYKYDDIKSNKKITSPEARKITKSSRKSEETFNNNISFVNLNDYFLSRGFAVVYASGIGTRGSDGIRTCGGLEETLSTISVIEWLNNNRVAFTNKKDNISIKAWWCNGSVGMTGKSYLGTLATAAATTGVKGLKTIISEAAISNWYDYYRDGGLVVAPEGFQGEDADVLAEDCFSRQKDAGDYINCKKIFENNLEQISKNQDRLTGNYNTFWDERNYLKNVKNIKCDVIMVHGLNDWNVKIKNVYNLYNKLCENNIDKKLFLHQGPHIYMDNFQSIDFTDMMNLWLSNKLYGINNNANHIIPDVCVQDNTLESTWHTFKEWHTSKYKQYHLYLDVNKIQKNKINNKKVISFNNQMSENKFNFYKKNEDKWLNELLKNDNKSKIKNNRIIFKSRKLNSDIYLQNIISVKLKVSSSVNKGMLSFMLVDFGLSKRLNKMPSIIKPKSLSNGFHWTRNDLVEYKLMEQKTPWKLITRGHINLQNRENTWKVDEIYPNVFYEINVNLQPTFYHILKSHQIGLVVYSTDMGMTIRNNEDINYCIDLLNCNIKISWEKINK